MSRIDPHYTRPQVDALVEAEAERAADAETVLQAAIDAVEGGDVDSVAGLSGTVTAAGLKTALSLPSDTASDLTALDGRLDAQEAESASLPTTYAPLPTSTPAKNALTGKWHVIGADATGTTDSSAIIQPYLNAAKAAGGGDVVLPSGTFLAELTMKHKVRLVGAGDQQTTIKAVSGSSNPGIIQFEVGYNQHTWIEDLAIRGNGNTGQHAVYAYAQPIAPDNNGGWWQGGMRRVTIHNLGTSGDCLHFDATTENGLLPHQFLLFEDVHAFAPVGGQAIYATKQTGQFTFINGQYDGPGLATGTTANINVTNAYSWTFVGTSFQNNLKAFTIVTSSAITLLGCYFENIGKSLTVTGTGTPSIVELLNCHFANAGYISAGDATGYIFSADTSSTVNVQGGKIFGNYSAVYAAGTTGVVNLRNVWHPGGTSLFKSIGQTVQIAVATDGSGNGNIAPTNGHKTFLVNASATQIKYISAVRDRTGGDEIDLRAFGGTIVLVSGYSDTSIGIDLGGLTSPLTVPSGGIVTLVRFDLGAGWVVKSTSWAAT